MMTARLCTLPFWLAVAGIATAWYLYIVRPDLPGDRCARRLGSYAVLERQVRLRRAQRSGSSPAARARVGTGLWKGGDVAVIDGVLVNGSARVGRLVRRRGRAAFQSGFIYQYAFTMIIGVFVLLTLWFAAHLT